MLRSISASLVVFALCLGAAAAASAESISYTFTFSVTRITDTPFGLASVPSPITTGRFIVDDSIFQAGAPELFDALPGFALIEPIVIGDVSFDNGDVGVAPGGRIVGGELTEVWLHALLIDPIEGQRELTTYFFPSFQFDGTDFNPEPQPSEHLFDTYTVARAEPVVPEPSMGVLLGIGFGAAAFYRRRRSRLHRGRVEPIS